MTTFATTPGVNSFETGGPNGALIRVESGKPYQTDDPGEIAILEAAGPHVLTSSPDAAAAAAPASAPAPKQPDKGGDA